MVTDVQLNQQLRDNFLAVAGTTGVLPSPHMTSPVVDSGGLTVTTGGLTVSAGGLLVTAGNITAGTTVAGAGIVRLPNNQNVDWRNASNSNDDSIGFNASDQFVIAPNLTTALTVTSAGIVFGMANARIIPGATALQIRNTADNANNIAISDAGDVTVRNSMSIGATPALTQALNIPNGNGLGWRNGANSGDCTLTMNSSNQLGFTNFATAGAAGAATGSLVVTINGVAHNINYT